MDIINAFEAFVAGSSPAGSVRGGEMDRGISLEWIFTIFRVADFSFICYDFGSRELLLIRKLLAGFAPPKY